MADNQVPILDGQTTWGELRECEKAWYMVFWAPIENNVRVEPSNNDIIQVGWHWAPPSPLQLSTVINTGETLVRTTNWHPNDEQINALLFWIAENPVVQ